MNAFDLGSMKVGVTLGDDGLHTDNVQENAEEALVPEQSESVRVRGQE